MSRLLPGDAGLDIVYVPYGRRVVGSTRKKVNVEEAHLIARECVKWVKDGSRSVGVAAMTQAQRDLIRECVEKEFSKEKISRQGYSNSKFFDSTEPFFIRTAGVCAGRGARCHADFARRRARCENEKWLG